MRRTVVVGAAIVVAACGESPDYIPSGVEITDSAGIRIVTSPPGDAVYAELATEPALSIGLLDGPDEFLFGDIESVGRDPSGNVVVADEQALEIRVVDPTGGYLRSVGREGEGPGEFLDLTGAWTLADGSIVTVDYRLDRITRFDAAGAPVGTATFSNPDDLIVLPVALGGPGAILSSATPSRGATLQDIWESLLEHDHQRVLFLRHRFDGTLIDTVAEGIDQAQASFSSGSGLDMVVQRMAVPFSPNPTARGSAHGVAFTSGAAYEISVFDEAGDLRLIARLDESPTIRTDEHIETYVRNPGGRERDEAWIRERLEQYRTLYLPESLPGYTDVLFTDTGDIWARRYRMRGDSMDRWDVFAADGIHLGRVHIPASLRVEEVTRGQVVGIATDEFGWSASKCATLASLGGSRSAPRKRAIAPGLGRKPQSLWSHPAGPRGSRPHHPSPQSPGDPGEPQSRMAVPPPRLNRLQTYAGVSCAERYRGGRDAKCDQGSRRRGRSPDPPGRHDRTSCRQGEEGGAGGPVVRGPAPRQRARQAHGQPVGEAQGTYHESRHHAGGGPQPGHARVGVRDVAARAVHGGNDMG